MTNRNQPPAPPSSKPSTKPAPAAPPRWATAIWSGASGARGEPLVLLHGGTGSWMHWMRNIEDLSRDFMLLVPDIPGSGESASPGMPTSVEKVAAALLAGIDAILGPQTPLLGRRLLDGRADLRLRRPSSPASASPCLVLVGADRHHRAARRDRADEVVAAAADRRGRSATAHRTNLEILMVRDPKAIDDAALYMQLHNAERSRVRGKHIIPTGDLSTDAAGIQGPARRHLGRARRHRRALSRRAAREARGSSSRARPSTSSPAPGIGCNTRRRTRSTGCCASG